MERRSRTTFVLRRCRLSFSHYYRWSIAIILFAILATGFAKSYLVKAKPCSGQRGTIHENGGGFIADTVRIMTGDPYIDETSEVCEYVTLYGSDVKIINGSKVRGRAHIADIVEINESIVEGGAVIDSRDGELGIIINNHSRIYGNAKIIEDITVSGSNVFGQVTVRGKAKVTSSQVYGQARVIDEASIENAKIHGKAQISGSAIVKSTSSLTEICDEVIVGGTSVIENSTKLCKSVPSAPSLSLLPKTKTFTDVPVGGVSDEVFFTIKNDGAVDATNCSALQFSGDINEFQVTQNTCTNSTLIAEGGSCLVKLRAKPLSLGTKKLTIARSCSTGGSVSTETNGVKVEAVASRQMSLSPLSAELPATALGVTNLISQKFTFQNTGTLPILGCEPVVLEGEDADEFTIVKNTCGTNDLPPLAGSNSIYEFDNPALFTISDSSKIEFANGVARLKKSAITSDSVFYASYNNSINGDQGNGNLTATQVGGASVSNGALNLNASDLRYVDYEALGKGDFHKVSTFRFRYIPNYQGSPATSQAIFTVFENANSNLNRIQLHHSNTGLVSLLAYDLAGATAASYNFGSYNAVQGEEVELELNMDFQNGETRLFINGIQLGSTLTTQINRIGTNITKIRIGSTRNAAYTANFSVGQFAIFSTVQHTSNYQIQNEWLRYPTDHPYIETLAAIPYTSALKNFEAITRGGSGDQVRFVISNDNGLNWKYWDGSNWSNSNGSFLQSTTASLVNNKLLLLGTNGNLKFRAIFHSANGSTTPVLDEVSFGNLIGACEVRLAAAPTSGGQKRTTLSRKCETIGEVKTLSQAVTYSAISPLLNVIPFNHQYGSVNIGSPAGNKTFTFRNDTPVTVQYCSAPAILGANPEDFQITSDSCGSSPLLPGNSCQVVVSASPQDIGTRSATLTRNCSQGGLASTDINGLSVFGLDANPLLAVNPEVVSFGDILMNTTSTSTVVTFNNIGGGNATSCQVPTITGPNASEFSIISDSCAGMDLPTGIGQCTVVVRTHPTGIDHRTASLNLTCASTPTVSAVLEVNSVVPGPTPNLLLSPLAFDFGQVPNGGTSSSHTFTIDNLGSGAATNCSKPYLTGADYSHFQIINDQCAENNLASGASCNIEIAATPTKVGLIKSTLNRTCIVGGTVRTLTNAITAQSLLVEPVLAISPTTHNFGTVAVGSQSSQTFTLSNSGLGNATQCSAPVIQGNTADFILLNDTCSTNNLPSMGTCSVELKFVPATSGNKNLTLKRNCVNGGELSASVSAQAIAPLLAMTPTTHNFGNTQVGATSTSATFTITNSGNGDAIGCTSPVITGADTAHFALSNVTCSGGTVPANGGTCSIDVSFSPLYRLPKNAQLQFSCSSGGLLTSALSGNGVAPVLAIAPVSHNFGNVPVGQSSAPQAFTMTNSGDISATGCSAPVITGADSSNFSLSLVNCPAGSIGAGGNCSVEVTFSPLTSNGKNATLERTCTNGGTLSASLTGTGNSPLLAISPSNSNFGSVNVGQTSAAQTLTITNSGNQNASGCSVPSITGADAAQFSVHSTTCSTGSIETGSSCAVDVKFSPTSRSIKEANIQLTCTTGGNVTASLNGKGIGAELAISPSSHNFGNILVGQTSSAQTFTVTNNGDGNAIGCTAPILTGTNSNNFAVSNINCSDSALTPGGTCDIEVSFSPLSTLAKNATLQFACSSGGTMTANVSGTGTGPVLSTTPTPINFGAIENGGLSEALTVTLSNTGTGSASGCSAFTLEGTNAAEFQIVNGSETCGNSLPVGDTCTIDLKANPVSLGNKTASLKKVCSIGGTLSTTISAVSTQSVLSVQPLSYNFGEIFLGAYSNYQDFVIENNGTVSASGCQPLSISGFNFSEFEIENPNACGSRLNPGQSCIAKVRAHPAALGLISASLNLQCNSTTLSSTLAATGTTITAQMAIFPTANEFGSVVMGTGSASRTFTIVNSTEGRATSCDSAVLEGPDASHFTIESSTCVASMGRKSNCQVTIVSSPSTLGAKKARLKRVCAIGGTAKAELSATSITGSPAIAFARTTIDFGEIPESQPSQELYATLSNQTEGKAFNCSAATLSGTHAAQFAITEDSCGTSPLASKGYCVIKLRANPSSAGAKEATLTRTCGVGGVATATLSATATATPGLIIANVKSINFGKVPSKNSSKVEIVTFANQGKKALLNCSHPKVTGEYADQFSIAESTCSSEFSSSCSVKVFASPSSPGMKSARLSFACGSTSMVNVPLITEATASNTAQVLADKSSFDFGNANVAQATKAQLITWTNQGPGPVSGCSPLAITGTNANEFKIESMNCSASLKGAKDSCSAYISAIPVTPGTKNAQVGFTCTVGGTSSVALKASAVNAQSSLAMTEKEFDFGFTGVNQASKPHEFILLNKGAGLASSCSAPALTGVHASQFKILEDNCSDSLASQRVCRITVVATPTSVGLKKAELSRHCAIGGKATAGLNAAGKMLDPNLKFETDRVEFTNVTLGQASEEKVIELDNLGAGPALNCQNPVITGPNASEFSIASHSCTSATMNAGTSCQVTLESIPSSLGKKAATISRTCTTGGTANATLSATAIAGKSAIVASTTSFNFLQVPIGQSSAVAFFKITNNSSSKVRNCAPSLAGTNPNAFRLQASPYNGCTATLDPGKSCNQAAEFRASAIGLRTGILKYTCTVGGEVQIAIEGQGIAATQALALTPTGINFTNVAVGTQSRDKVLTMKNTSPGAFRACAEPAITGPNASEFNLSYQGLAKACTGLSLIQPGEYCQVIVAAAPAGSVGDKNASLNFSCQVGGSVSAPLYARGVLPGPPQLFVQPSLLAFDSLQKSQLSLTIKNEGEEDAEKCELPEIIGESKKAFKIVSTSCNEDTHLSGESCKVTIAPSAPVATIGSHSVLIRRSCQIGGDVMAIARTNSSKTGPGVDYKPIKLLKGNAQNCVLFDNGQVECLDTGLKFNLSQNRTPSSTEFAKDFYRKDKKTCVKTIKNQEMCWENL
nr:hypothetical protein BHI3_22570 [Bacteriovorax sp. HI3]